MGIKRYKYYFYKPKSEIVKDVLSWLAIAGAVYIAASSPYFVRSILRNITNFSKYPRKKLSSTFYRLKKEGLIEIKRKGKQFYISLTREGKKKAGRFQIDALKIKKPKKWDKKYRVVIFDISQLKKFLREVFRGKLKELGFYQLQKSVWVHAFDCEAEIELLKEFFGLSERELKLIVAEKIDEDDKVRDFFKLK